MVLEEVSDMENRLEKIIGNYNITSIVLKIAAWIIFFCCLIVGGIWAKKIGEYWMGVAMLTCWCFGGSFLFLVMYTVSEIIQILHDIRKKVWIMAAKNKE